MGVEWSHITVGSDLLDADARTAEGGNMIKTYCDRCGAEIETEKHTLLKHKTNYAVQS